MGRRVAAILVHLPVLTLDRATSANRAVGEGELIHSPALHVQDGKVRIPDAPGWGVTLNPAWLEKAAYQQSER